MLVHMMRLYTLFIILITTFLLFAPYAHASEHSAKSATQLADFPTIDPNYIYDQLFFMATHFQHRESGYDTNLSVTENGHDEYADYWSNEMVHNLQDFGPQIRRDLFSVRGWRGRPATTQAFNVEVTVPGAIHPEQMVVIGCHYDGEAISTQSANDDASGCAIELGVAKALGDYWRMHKSYPARTIRFVIFDAEEQGLLGSFHYVNNTVNGDTSNIVAMFNEEQNGIAYPLRYLGKLANPLLPFFIEMSPLQSSQLYPHQDRLTPVQRDRITQFRSLMQQAVPAVFQQFQALSYQGLTYHDDNKQDNAQPIFIADHMGYIKQEDDTLGGSDQIPFTLAGLPCATFAGNSTYYDANPPAWSYPFDQRQDTIQLMNTFADGSSQKSNALMLALALPGMLTTWMLHQPAILGETTQSALPAGPLATISDIGITKVGQPLTVDAQASFDTRASNQALTYNWDFGDGSKGNAVTASHSYTKAGTYTLTLTITSGTGTRTISKTINVTAQATTYRNPYEDYLANGNPQSNSAMQLPQADDTLSDKIVSSSALATNRATGGLDSGSILPLVVTVIAIVIVLSLGVILLVVRKRRTSLQATDQ